MHRKIVSKLWKGKTDNIEIEQNRAEIEQLFCYFYELLDLNEILRNCRVNSQLNDFQFPLSSLKNIDQR